MQNRPAIPRVNLRMKIPTACSPTRRWTRDDEICDILDLNKTTVYKRLQRAYRMARERMAKNDETGT